MNEIIVKMPKVPELRYRKCKRCMNSKKLPKLKLPSLKTDQHLIMRGMTAGLVSEVIGVNTLKHDKSKKEKPVIGAGRGGKVYSKVSNMGRIAESAAPAKREKRVPCKPNPEMHALWAISDMRTGLI